MWLPHVNQTVMRTMQSAGYSVVRVNFFFCFEFDSRKTIIHSHFYISSRDYREVRGGIWDFCDSEQDIKDFSSLSGMVKINRLPGSFAICKKDELVTNYKWLQQRSGKILIKTFPFCNDWMQPVLIFFLRATHYRLKEGAYWKQ